ncbi:MAG: hypothetical protein R2865_14760 [Deinococcales bacterium]
MPSNAPYNPKAVRVTLTSIYAKPSPQHLLGTDDAGKDVLSNLSMAQRVSLTAVGLFVSQISVLIGGSIGLLRFFWR